MKNVNGRDVSRCVSFKIRPKPVALTEDLTDHIIPTIRKKPDILVIHTGTIMICKTLQHREKSKEICKCNKKACQGPHRENCIL